MLNRRDDVGIWKSMSIGNLKKAIADLPDDWFIYINDHTGNINVCSGDRANALDDTVPRGVIDVLAEEYQPVD